MEIKIKYFSEDYPRLERIKEGDWVDLRVDKILSFTNYSGMTWDLPEDGILVYSRGDIIKVGLGVAMELPKGYEAHVSPRSSTFGSWGLLQTNGMGIIDNSYNGDEDEWMMEFVAMRSGILERFERVIQFRIMENQPKLEFVEVEHLGNDNRGGYGSTGRD